MHGNIVRHLLVSIGSILAVTATNVPAHHGPIGPALYEADELFVVEGEIAELFWRSPHVRFAVTENSESGEETLWEIELAPGPNQMSREGLSEDMFPVGGHVKVAGFVSRRNSRSIGMRHLLLPDGREYTGAGNELLWGAARVEPGAPAAPDPVDPAVVAAAEREASGIFRNWSGTMAPSEWARLNQYDHLLTPQAAQTLADWDPTTHPVLDCVPRGFPESMVMGNFEFVRQGDTIRIGNRVVHMDSEGVPAGTEHSHLGYSTGHWEGDTLVVRTTHVNWPYFDRAGTPQSEQTEFVERFTISGDERHLDTTLTATDPANFLEPITTVNRYEWRPRSGMGAMGTGQGGNGARCELWDITGESG